MNKFLTLIGLTLTLASNLCYAEWVSPIDKQYADKEPTLYSMVAQAKSLISDAHGNTTMQKQSIGLAISVLRQDPKFAPVYVQFARATIDLGYISDNQYKRVALQSAEAYLRTALDLEPNYDYALVMLGYTMMFQGNLDEAEKYYKKAIEMKSKYPYLKSQLAQLYSKRGNYRKAIKVAKEAYKEQKSDPSTAAGIVTEIIKAYEELGPDYKNKMEKWQTKRTTLAPNVAWYWGDHARLRLYYFGDAEGTIKYAKKALSLMDYGLGRYNLAGGYYKKWADLKEDPTQAKEAKIAWEKANKLYPVRLDMIREFMSNPSLKTTGEALLEQYKKDRATPISHTR